MKILAINSCNYGSTGNIMLNILELAQSQGNEVMAAVPKTRRTIARGTKNTTYIGGFLLRNIGLRLARISGLYGCFSLIDTLIFLKKLKKFSPDIIHLHNLHDSYINIPLLFKYIKKHKVPVVWTLHDCWSFTGHCPHFLMTKCDKWRTGCYDCPVTVDYPASMIDSSKFMWKQKNKWFSGVDDMTIVTPSEWLAGLVKQSFLRDYHVRVINNGIDLRIFKPIISSFREKYRINNQYIVLGVALGWDKRKGLDVFIDLSKTLDERFKIVLVGTNDIIDNDLPSNIISIHKTYNQSELAEIYSSSDVFVNPTREDNFPTVNLEALGCGTPVITFETGGSPEMLSYTCGSVVSCNDMDKLKIEIVRICVEKPYSSGACRMQAINYDKNNCFKKYVDLYNNLCMAEAEFCSR